MSSQATFSAATEAQGNQFLGSSSSSAEVLENATANLDHTNHFWPTNGLPIDVDICEYFGNLSLPPPKRRKTNPPKGVCKVGNEPYYPRRKKQGETDLSFEEASIRSICEWEETGKNTIPEDVGDHMDYLLWLFEVEPM
eukprot:TRINITY_DN64751_c0_g1_i1.p1 TRINITY_DN64751_c0_g1~~TRINITY_DN64751_c0_g1_i1.p1  ORF type:complete len:139 (-),score=13.99 TRINITY_DN64751_c0_g1_i1:295-711(-)